MTEPWKPTCGECRFRVKGECHRYPPSLVPVATGTNGPAGAAIYFPDSWWPKVESGSWCGEFKSVV